MIDRNSQKLTIQEAIDLANEYGEFPTSTTVRNWCERYDIGNKIGGQWRVNKKRLKLLLEGKTWKLEEDQNKNKK